jgi:hypothetical protein
LRLFSNRSSHLRNVNAAATAATATKAAAAHAADNPANYPAPINAAAKPTCAAACSIKHMLLIYAGMAICSSYLYSIRHRHCLHHHTPLQQQISAASKQVWQPSVPASSTPPATSTKHT